jgi:hypothetical protein
VDRVAELARLNGDTIAGGGGDVSAPAFSASVRRRGSSRGDLGMRDSSACDHRLLLIGEPCGLPFVEAALRLRMLTEQPCVRRVLRAVTEDPMPVKDMGVLAPRVPSRRRARSFASRSLKLCR